MSKIKQFASNFKHNNKHYKSGESASNRPGQGVRDSILTTMGQTSAGAFTGLISRPLMLTLVLTIPAFFITTLLFSSNNTYADDSITVTISGSPTITVAPTSGGTFADSGNINISVTNAPASGYTLAITGGGNTSLTGTTDSTKSITTISSAIDQNTFNTSTYNNKWGYKPSMHYNTSTESRANNSNYLPSPDANGDIIDITSDNSSNNYTMSIGARVTNTLGFQTYENNTFVISAVGNSSVLDCDSTKLCVEYEGNGLNFDGETLNRVNYNSTGSTETVTKYSHTSNISDDGTQSGNYPNGASTNDVITINGASSLHVKITYATESTNYDWAVIWAGNYPNYTAASNYSSGITCGGRGPKLGGTTKTTVECDISGDTVTFGFKSDGSVDNYGYYAVITGTASTIERSVASGEYATPTGTNAIFHGWSSTQTTAGGGLPSDVEYADEADVMANIPGDNGDTQTLYAVWQQGQPITFNMDSNVSSIAVLDSSGATVDTITTSGQSLLLAQGDTYTIKPTHASGYGTNTITKTSGAGTLSGKEFTVGAGVATISVTSRTVTTFDQAYAAAGKTKYNNYYKIQDMNSTICSNVSSADSGVIGQVIDTRDNEVYKIAKLKDGKCWMLDNLRLDPTGVSLATLKGNTNASDTTLGYLKNGGGTTSNQYATDAVSDWYSHYGNYYSVPFIKASYLDTTTTSYGAGSGKIGVYYNYCAASAGSYCYGDRTSGGTSSGNATEDLCPAGWRMPGGSSTINLTATPPTGEFQNLYSYYNTTQTATDTNSLQYNLSLPLSGYFYSGSTGPSATGQGSQGYWWSSTRTSDNIMYILRVDASYVYPATANNRAYALPLRCVAQ